MRIAKANGSFSEIRSIGLIRAKERPNHVWDLLLFPPLEGTFGEPHLPATMQIDIEGVAPEEVIRLVTVSPHLFHGAAPTIRAIAERQIQEAAANQEEELEL